MKKTAQQDATELFKQTLLTYKSLIDTDISAFCTDIVSATNEQFGEYSTESMKVFCDVLARGGKRIRGALTMHAYAMYGGKDPQVAIEAARIMELIQTYLLIIDDVYDRSRTRRGSPSAHVMLESLHTEHHWKADAHHFGETIAINSGIIGCHMAMTLVTKLNVENAVIVKALNILNTNLQITGEGQANDVFNEVAEISSSRNVENVLVWKTAYYTFVNPLQFGATLAGADEVELEKLREYSLAAGRTFQITDDILGIFGSEFESGKSPMDDIREGKRTLLTVHALKHASKEDAYFLQSMLGNNDLTQAEFSKCCEIIEQAGSLAYAKKEAGMSCEDAHQLVRGGLNSLSHKDTVFLEGLVQYLLTRKS
jgi:geranylgeranyl pyrophosphate synthase